MNFISLRMQQVADAQSNAFFMSGCQSHDLCLGSQPHMNPTMQLSSGPSNCSEQRRMLQGARALDESPTGSHTPASFSSRGKAQEHITPKVLRWAPSLQL